MPKQKRYSRNEFRYNKNTKHYNYVFEEDGNKFHSIGLTHKNYTYDNKKRKWRKNMPLDKNPQKSKSDNVFVRYGIITSKKDNYGDKRNNFEFSRSDFSNVKVKVRNYKNQRRKK